MVYRIAVLDDDMIQLQRTEEFLLLYDREHPEHELEVSCYSRMTAFMEAVCRKEENGQWAFDILLMDIYLPDGDGIESARVLRQKGFKSVIIFQSSSEEHAIDAFSVSALQYLVKPVCREKLDRTIERAIDEIQHNPVQESKEETNGQGDDSALREKERRRHPLRYIANIFKRKQE